MNENIPPLEDIEDLADESGVKKVEESATVPVTASGQRLDQAAAELFSSYSRSKLQAWIKSGELTVNGSKAKTRDKMLGGEQLDLNAELQEQGSWKPEAIDLDIVYEDEAILVLNKPMGLVVHPAAGNHTGTLLNALLHHSPDLIHVPRAGIVHRLDKDTTGLMVVAKTLEAHTDLVAQLQERSVSREYEAISQGVMTGGGMVEANIGRHPKQRTKMAVSNFGGKEAITHYRVIQRFDAYTHIRLKLETGRTHQIRVHMSHIGYPLVGDSAYAGRFKIPKGLDKALIEKLRSFPRQALHAAQLGLIHPISGEYMEWEADLPEDMVDLLRELKDAQGPAYI
ncbi:23S rRNA pseudouridine(1911/1915/1917) synthase RluD [Pseudoteredinibacter isoporae]|uniref:Pseudouridine synthase n=1 Tax=Pseudoteredinibacter isoporae TaxID=570281 RepID=A0A7X0JS80_9GAMM|nr:23S rRNA pseudouridine(1911/1915/1917) synthase RluD [Pseudoteredinibacter isoporae]MBB6521334.1 23S rRNA pseudouridine1911/1915/1917 synthase [Pseudoteredinibacter isoporae]NHO86889.1 23S rRNA pseudouridine(1911/1915/1917) synthase RluD [Pseudoteredinibacter isoporae]NIB24659.1 23S rRNA pseudouridine(1911/1915/1917) synthase RluD [Pseudoteredinibacter isoporae]